MYITLDLRFDDPIEEDFRREVLVFFNHSQINNNQLGAIMAFINEKGQFLDCFYDEPMENVECWCHLPLVELTIKLS
jgi:hypothetical protein